MLSVKYFSLDSHRGLISRLGLIKLVSVEQEPETCQDRGTPPLHSVLFSLCIKLLQFIYSFGKEPDAISDKWVSSDTWAILTSCPTHVCRHTQIQTSKIWLSPQGYCRFWGKNEGCRVTNKSKRGKERRIWVIFLGKGGDLESSEAY